MRLFYRALLSYLSVFSYLPVTSMQTVLRSLTLTPHQRFSLTYLFNFARKFLQVVLPKDTLRSPGVQNYFFASSTLFSNTFKSLLIKLLKSFIVQPIKFKLQSPYFGPSRLIMIWSQPIFTGISTSLCYQKDIFQSNGPSCYLINIFQHLPHLFP